MSVFSRNKNAKPRRSKFNLSHRKAFTCNFGEIVPCYLQEVLPSDKFNVSPSVLAKLAPMQSPVFSDIQASIHYFFVPNRLIWDGWERWISGGAWGADTEVQPLPQFPLSVRTDDAAGSLPSDAFDAGTLWDYMTGSQFFVPATITSTQDYGINISQLPFRAYHSIVENYFIDETLQNGEMFIDRQDGTQDPTTSLKYQDGLLDLTDAGEREMATNLLTLRYANWKKDYFTSALPFTQRGNPVNIISTVTSSSSSANINASGTIDGTATVSGTIPAQSVTIPDQTVSTQPYSFTIPATKVVGTASRPNPATVGSGVVGTSTSNTAIQMFWRGNTTTGYMQAGSGTPIYLQVSFNAANSTLEVPEQTVNVDGQDLIIQGSTFTIPERTINSTGSVTGTADVSGTVDVDVNADASVSVNDVRKAFQVQRWLEASARGGYRYIEQILSHFGVHSPDARLQRPEYLGGVSVKVDVNEVLQTAPAETGQTPQANMAGHGQAFAHSKGFKRSFTEHGYIIGVFVCRPKALYTQGIYRDFLKQQRFDFFWHEFAHIGEQSIKNCEVRPFIPQDGSVYDNFGDWGYVPRYQEYRYNRDTVHGFFHPSAGGASPRAVNNNLASWTQGRFWESDMSNPTLSPDFLRCNEKGLYRPFWDTGNTAHHIYVYLKNNVKAIRPVPKFGEPAFIDHV